MRRRGGFALLAGVMILMLIMMYMTGLLASISSEEADRERTRLFAHDLRLVMEEAGAIYRSYAASLSAVERAVSLGTNPTGTAAHQKVVGFRTNVLDKGKLAFNLSTGLFLINASDTTVSMTARMSRTVYLGAVVVAANVVSTYDAEFEFVLPGDFDNDEMMKLRQSMLSLSYVSVFEPDYETRRNVRVTMSFGRGTGTGFPSGR